VPPWLESARDGRGGAARGRLTDPADGLSGCLFESSASFEVVCRSAASQLDGVAGAGLDTSLAAAAVPGMVNMSVPVDEKLGLAQDVIWAGLHAVPAGLT
jgi:hypothetical protein